MHGQLLEMGQGDASTVIEKSLQEWRDIKTDLLQILAVEAVLGEGFSCRHSKFEFLLRQRIFDAFYLRYFGRLSLLSRFRCLRSQRER